MKKKAIRVGQYELPLGERTLIMGILNVTPDSFSDGGKFNQLDQALMHAQCLADAGADVIDIGGESTRPGSDPVSLEEELERTIPIIERITKEISLPLSIDTYKSVVAEEAVKAGASMINDIWGAKKDPGMAKVAATLDVPIILMHNRNEPKYMSLIDDIKKDLLESVAIAKQAGVPKEQIILDPGIGFAKNVDQNLQVMRNLDAIVDLGYSVLLGTSRKSMIGHVLDLPVEERLEGTAATVAIGIAQGCQWVRVHDVEAIARVAKMTDAMLAGRQLIQKKAERSEAHGSITD